MEKMEGRKLKPSLLLLVIRLCIRLYLIISSNLGGQMSPPQTSLSPPQTSPNSQLHMIPRRRSSNPQGDMSMPKSVSNLHPQNSEAQSNQQSNELEEEPVHGVNENVYIAPNLPEDQLNSL